MKDFSSFMDKVLEKGASFDPPKVSFHEFCQMFNPDIATNTSDKKTLLDFIGNMDFALMEQRVLANMIAGKQPAVLVGVDIAPGRDEGSIAIGVEHHGMLKILMIDDIRRSPYDGPATLEMTHQTQMSRESKIRGLRVDRAIIDELVELDRQMQMPPLVQEEEEPTAKNGMKASRKTQAAKAKLPFYHKNRRF